jgi:hypothetical protein
MRKFGFFALAVLTLAGFAGWVASTSQARVATPTAGVRIDPMEMMMTGGNLPIQHVVDYSLVYD